MSGIKNWHDYFANTLGGTGFDFALNKEVKRREVPPGMIFKYNEGKKYYASLGMLPLARTASVRVSLELLRPVFKPEVSPSPVVIGDSPDKYKYNAALNISVNNAALNSSVFIKGAFSFVCVPFHTGKNSNEQEAKDNLYDASQVEIGPLTHTIASRLGVLIRLPKDKHVYMMLGWAPEMPETKALVMRLTEDADDKRFLNSSATENVFLKEVDLGSMVAVVGGTKLLYWLSNK